MPKALSLLTLLLLLLAMAAVRLLRLLHQQVRRVEWLLQHLKAERLQSRWQKGACLVGAAASHSISVSLRFLKINRCGGHFFSLWAFWFWLALPFPAMAVLSQALVLSAQMGQALLDISLCDDEPVLPAAQLGRLITAFHAFAGR